MNAAGTRFMLARGKEALRLRILNGLRIFRGHWKFDLRRGLPMFESVLIKNPDTRIVRAVFRDFLLQFVGVAEVSRIELRFNREDRIMNLDFVLRTDTGEELQDTFPYEVA